MASLPCAVGTRIFTIKETGEKLTYDQMRKHLFDNPSLMEEEAEVSPAVKEKEEIEALKSNAPKAEAPAEEVTPAPIAEAAPTEEKAPEFGEIEQGILDWTRKQRELMKGAAKSGGALYIALLDAIDLGVKAGRAIADVINDFRKANANRKDQAEKAINEFIKNSPKEIFPKARVATFFSGAGTMEAGLSNAKSVSAVEFTPEYIEAFNKAHGTAYETRSVNDITPAEVKAANPDIFHASPVCKNFSAAKSKKTVEKSDMDSADAVARVIREATPPVVTVENVAAYKDTAPYNAIIDALKDAGYTYDVGVYNAADFGGIQNRDRLLIRAVKSGELPPIPEKQKPGDWYSAIKNLIDAAPDSKFVARTNEEHWEKERINKMIKNGELDASKPIITMGGSIDKNRANAANAGGPAPTLKSTSKEVPRIIMPDGKVKRVTPEMMRRIMGLPDSFQIPNNALTAKEVLGNGMDAAFTKALINPLLNRGKQEAAPTSSKSKEILDWVAGQRKLLKETATSGGALYGVLLDAIEAGVIAGKTIADVVAKFKDDYKQNYKNARKAIDFLQKGAPKTILEQLKQRNAPTKKEVQTAIDRAFAVGMGMGENKGEQAGIREGKKSVATLLAALLEPLKGKLNAGQITAIVRRVPKIYNPETYDKFLDYVEGVIDDANYDVRVAALAKLKTKALRDLKGKDISQATAANLLSPIRNLGLNKISPEDIGTYEEMLKDISNSRTGKQIGRMFSEEDIIEFIEEQEAKYQAKRDSRLQGKLDMEKELGLLPDNFTLQDYKDLLAGDIDEDAIDIKYKVPYEELLKRALPYLVQDVKAAAADRNYQGAQKQVVDELLDIDIDKLELPELILLNNVFSNIVESDDISNAGKIIAKVAANNRIAEFEKNNKRAGFEDSPLRIRAMSPENAAKSSYQNILANLTYNRDDSNALKTLLTSPLQRAFYKIQGKAVAEALDLSKYMLKHKIGEDANHKLGILTIAQQESAEGGTFKERVERIKEMAEKQLAEGEAQLKNADKDIRRRAKDNIDDAKLKLKIIDKYFKGKESAADVALSPAEKETMDRALKAFAKRKDDLAATTKAFYNKDMKDGGALYFPLLPYYKFGPSEEKVEGITENLFVPSVLDRTQAGSTKDRNPFLSTNVSYNTDFIGVFTQKLFEADYQIETTKERFVTQNILNDKRTKLALNPVGGKGAYDVLSDKIQEIVSDQKTFSALYKKDESIAAYLLNKLVPLFLNSVEQIPKQATGLWLVAFNTNEASFGKAVMVNGQSVRNKEVKDAINKLRAASSIVLRGHRGEIDIREKYQLRKGLFSDNPLFRKYSSLQQMGDDISTWIGSQTIQRGDDIVTNTALVAAYIDALIKNGKLKNAEDFDIVEAAKNIDEKSLSYAETFVDEVNAPSDPTTKAAALKSKKGDIKEAGVSAKNLFWTLKGFSLANNKNLKSAIGVMNDTRASDSEKFEALEKISGIVYATVSFALVGLGLKMGKEEVSNLIAQQILGMEPPEEDEKKRKEKFAARMAQIAFNIGGEFAFGGYSAPVEQAAKVIINVGYKTAAALSEGAIPEKLGLPEKFQPYPYTDGVAGGLGIPTELIVKTAEKFSEKDPETGKRRETTSDQFMFNVVIPMIAFQTGAGDAYKWNDMIARKISPKAQEDIKNAYKAQIKEEMAEPGSKEAKEAKKEFDKAIKEGDFETAQKKYDAQEAQFKTTREKLKFAGDAFRSFVDDKVAPSYGVNDKDIVDLFRKASGQPMKIYINISEKGKRTGRLKLLTDQEMKFILEDYDTQYAKMKKELQFMDDLKKKNFYGVTMVYSKRGMPLWVRQYEKYKGIKP